MKTMLVSQEFKLMICLCSENSFSNIEDPYFESLGTFGEASNAPGQFHWCFPRIFSESRLSESQILFLVSIWSNTNIATSFYAQAQPLHLFQSQGNFWNRLTNVSSQKSMRNFGKIKCEFQTAGYLAFLNMLKPYPFAGCVECMNIRHGVVFHVEPVRNVRVGSLRRFPEKPTNRYLQPYISAANCKR